MLFQTLKNYYLKLSTSEKLLTFKDILSKITQAFAGGLAAATIALGWCYTYGIHFLANYREVKEIQTDFMSIFQENLKNSTVESPSSKANYIERKDLETEIKDILASGTTDKYTVIYGNKGVGKTKLITQCVAGKKSAVRVGINAAHSKEEIFELILKKINGKISTPDLDKLEIPIKKLNEEGIYPIVIFDVESGGSKNEEIALPAVRGICKTLAPYCHCFIVLSEANAVTTFGRDNARERYIFVDDLSIEETKEFFEKNNYSISDEQIKYVFDNIGTKPANLLEILTEVPKKYSLKGFVEEKISGAREDLKGFPLKTILKALKEHPDGVDPEYFNNQIERGVDLSDQTGVGEIMKKKLNPIIYRKDTKKYHLLSTAHKTALKSYEPIAPIPPPTTQIAPKTERTWYQYFTGNG